MAIQVVISSHLSCALLSLRQWLGHMTCFGQWDISEHNGKKVLVKNGYVNNLRKIYEMGTRPEISGLLVTLLMVVYSLSCPTL